MNGQEVPSEYGKNVTLRVTGHCNKLPREVTQRGSGVSFYGDIQNMPRCHPVQCDLDDPARQGVGLDDFRGPFQPCPFCDSVKCFQFSCLQSASSL